MSAIERKSVEIVGLGKKSDLTINDEALNKVFEENKHLLELPVVVVSIVGAYRTGKSFLLNFILKFLYHMYTSEDSKKSSSDWLENENTSLKGFDWKRGKERVTQGVQMWPKAFCVTLPNGKQVAIVLLDFQGLFDHKTDTSGNSKLFALSSVISSLQIFNIRENIQMDDLQHLELFTNYGLEIKKMGDATAGAPFQKLLILVRDWEVPEENAYGLQGGQELVDEVLADKNNAGQEEAEPDSLGLMKKHIRSCFTDIGGCLMPHPGKKVTSDVKFTGEISDIDEDFKECLRKLIPSLFSPEKLVLKTINKREVKFKHLYQYINVVVNNLNEMTAPMSILEANAEASHRMAYEESMEMFKKKMKCISDESSPSLSHEDFISNCERACISSRECFESYPKFGGNKYKESYLQKLQENLEMISNLYYEINLKKIAVNSQEQKLEAQKKKLAAQEKEINAKEADIDYLRRENSAFEKEYREKIAELNSLREKLEEAENSAWKPANIAAVVGGTALTLAGGAAAAFGGRAVLSMATRYALPVISTIIKKVFMR